MPEKKSPRTRAPKAAQGKKLVITQTKSRISAPPAHRKTLDALGLRRHQRTVEVPDSPSVRGMIFQVRHLVEIQDK